MAYSKRITMWLCFIIWWNFIQGHVQTQRDIHPNEQTFSETWELDRAIVDFLKTHHYSGATVGVSGTKWSHVSYLQGYGSTIEGSLLKSSTLLPVSSISKLITAIAVLKLTENDRLQLNDFVFGKNGILSDLVPFPNQDAADRRLYSIQVQHLLHHTSGLGGSYSTNEPLMNQIHLLYGHKVINISEEMGLDHQINLDDVIQFVMGQPLGFSPGSKYQYSNLGYSILGRIVETITSLPYENFVQSEIFTPLGMWKTQLYHKKNLRMLEVNDLRQTGSEWVSFFPYLKAALGWLSNIPDLMRLMNGLSAGKILSLSSMGQMFSPPPAPASEHKQHWYGLGVHAGNDGTWWQIGDPYTNEILMFHSDREERSQNNRPFNLVVILSENNHRNLRGDLPKLFEGISNWPDADFSFRDCVDASVSSDKTHNTIISTQVPATHFQAFSNALASSGYIPTWINTYTRDRKPHVSSIWDRRDGEYLVISGVKSTELSEEINFLHAEGFQLASVSSYKEHKSVKHIALFSKSASILSFGWERREEEYAQIFNYYSQLNIPPTIQSFINIDDQKFVTFMFTNRTFTSWKSYSDLSKEQFEMVAKENAHHDRLLIFADSYTYLDDNLFSVIFANAPKQEMQLESSITRRTLQTQAKEMSKRRYQPQIIAGYEDQDETKFVILWVKH